MTTKPSLRSSGGFDLYGQVTNVETTHRPGAVLLLGPTASGKTPLGGALETLGLRGKRCHHFDFGGQLRDIVATGVVPEGLTSNDVNLLQEVLERGLLLEDEQFGIAEAILRSFISTRQVGRDELIVLNGLPRHVGQAADIDRIVDVIAVIELSCKLKVVLERIWTNAGGDRLGRCDDEGGFVRKKLQTYRERTALLVDHYRQRGIGIQTICVKADTSAEEVLGRLDGPARPDQEGQRATC